MQCGEVLQCSDGPSNKVLTLLEDINNSKVLLICILLLSHSFIFFRFYFYEHMVVFLFNTVICVFLLLGLCIIIVRLQ